MPIRIQNPALSNHESRFAYYKNPLEEESIILFFNNTDKRIANLIRSLESQNPRTRRETVLKLGYKGAEAQGAIPKLINILKDTVKGVRGNAALALGWLGSTLTDIGLRKEILSVLSKAFISDQALKVKEKIALAISRFKTDAIPFLEKAIKDKDINVQRLAVISLVDLDIPRSDKKAREKVVQILESLLNSDDNEVKSFAEFGLQTFKR